jgi:hypothetical protein
MNHRDTETQRHREERREKRGREGKRVVSPRMVFSGLMAFTLPSPLLLLLLFSVSLCLCGSSLE